jgi:putative transposase
VITLVKVVKLQIIKPIDLAWEGFEKILRQLQQDTRNIKNRTIQLCWEYQGFSSEYKEKYGEYPKYSDILEYNTLTGYIYDRLKRDYYRLNTGNLTDTIKSAADKWRNDLVEVLKGDISIPSYKKEGIIHVKSSCYKIIHDNDKYHIRLSLLSATYRKELNLDKGQIDVAIKVSNNNQKATLQRILSGEYKQSSSQLVKMKNKWFFYLAFQFEPQKTKELDPNNVMGIDMGITYPIYFAFNNSLKRGKIDGGEIENFRRRVEKRRRELLVQGKYCGDGRRGHGVQTRIKPIKRIGDKISRFKDTVNHKYSRYIVDMAVKNNCGVIQMENLKGISKNNIFLKDWTYFDLQTKIEYKAKEKGIVVKKIDPKYTSQRCSKCGYINRENRVNRRTFKCVRCDYGHKFYVNADYNAAKNIATPGIKDIIKKQIEWQKENDEWKTGIAG